jgi:hypothetical protein
MVSFKLFTLYLALCGCLILRTLRKAQEEACFVIGPRSIGSMEI